MLKILAFGFSILGCISCTPSSTLLSAGDDFNVIELTIEQTHEALRSNRISCETLTRRYLNRIEAYDQATKLNSIIYINPKAIEKARLLDKKFTESGAMNTLHCIPVILKDNFDTADMPTEAGAIALKGSSSAG